MTVTVGPPTRYRGSNGRSCDTGHVDGWPWPAMRQDDDGRWWTEHVVTDRWVPLGYGPRPRNRRQAFRIHVCHGLLMGYPLLAVLAWSWRNRNSFPSGDDAA